MHSPPAVHLLVWSSLRYKRNANNVQDPQASYRALPEGNDLAKIAVEAADLAAGREDLAIMVARKIFLRMYEVNNSRSGHSSSPDTEDFAVHAICIMYSVHGRQTSAVVAYRTRT